MKRIVLGILTICIFIAMCACSVFNRTEEPDLSRDTSVRRAVSDSEHVPGQYEKISISEKYDAITGVESDKTQHSGDTTENPDSDEDNSTNGDNGSTVEPDGEVKRQFTVVLDPGHGGRFAGMEYNGRQEKKYTLELAGYIKDYLEEHEQIKVFLTRESDKELSEKLAEDLELRAAYAKDMNADIMISIHFNALEKHNGSGCMGFISNQPNVNEESGVLSELILERISSIGLPNDGTKTRDSNDMKDAEGKPLDYYAINRHCAARDIPGVIIEHCFLDNDQDYALIDSPEKLKRMAELEAGAIVEYFGLK